MTPTLAGATPAVPQALDAPTPIFAESLARLDASIAFLRDGKVIKEGIGLGDMIVLREALRGAEHLREALRFYAARWHFDMADPSAWDTVSGEPQNFWCDEAGTATVEDGRVAAMALRGVAYDWTYDGGEAPPLCPGEPGAPSLPAPRPSPATGALFDDIPAGDRPLPTAIERALR